ncbi:MAG: DUF2029 domain-containing protein [Prevotella sp.]|nr:DUF2029 domain-containing protein [Prevotella sp.]
MGLWLLIGAIAALTKLPLHRCNNFLIFKGVFWHALHKTPMYAPYPAEYYDVNHYGPLFSLIIAPFAVVPHWLGLLARCVGLSLFCFWAVSKSTLTRRQQVFIYWFCAHELLTALFMQQFNVGIAAMLLLTFYCVEKEKDWLATLCIVLGMYIKLYGIVGLAFFFFSRHKGRFALSFFVWSIMLFVAPMLISSPAYIIEQYKDWYIELVHKNAVNNFGYGEGIRSNLTNISLLGIVRRITLGSYSDLWLIISGLMLFCAPYLRLDQWRSLSFRQMFLASTMMFMCLFSTGTESSGYITALIGCCVWYCCVPWKRSRLDISLMVLAFILTSLSPSDLVPAWIRNEYIKPFALKALPVSIIWFKLTYEMLTRNYTQGYGTENIRRH